QAEDGIRDKLVTGVQTCALPICSVPDSAIQVSIEPSLLRPRSWRTLAFGRSLGKLSNFSLAGSNRTIAFAVQSDNHTLSSGSTRSEERRVGKEGSTRWVRGA